MSTLKRIIYLTKDQKEELLANKTITVNGKTVEYDKDDLYLVDAESVVLPLWDTIGDIEKVLEAVL